MQMKITMRYHFSLTRLAIIKKRQTLTNFGEDVEKLEPSYTAYEKVNSMMQPLWKTIWQSL